MARCTLCLLHCACQFSPWVRVSEDSCPRAAIQVYPVINIAPARRAFGPSGVCTDGGAGRRRRAGGGGDDDDVLPGGAHRTSGVFVTTPRGHVAGWRPPCRACRSLSCSPQSSQRAPAPSTRAASSSCRSSTRWTITRRRSPAAAPSSSAMAAMSTPSASTARAWSTLPPSSGTTSTSGGCGTRWPPGRQRVATQTLALHQPRQRPHRSRSLVASRHRAPSRVWRTGRALTAATATVSGGESASGASPRARCPSRSGWEGALSCSSSPRATASVSHGLGLGSGLGSGSGLGLGLG